MPPSFLRFSLTLTTHFSGAPPQSPPSDIPPPPASLSALPPSSISLISSPPSGDRRPPVHLELDLVDALLSPPPFSHRRRRSSRLSHHRASAASLSSSTSSTVHLVDALLPPAPFSHRRRRSSLTIGSAVSSSEENLPQPFMSNSRNQNGRSLPPFGNFISYIHSRKHEVYAPATSLRERESWNLYDKKIVHTEYISKSSMTSDNLNKRICVRTEVNPQPSEVPSLEELFRAPRVLAESNGDWVISMMNHYDFPSDIKSMLAAKLLDNPSMFPLMVGFDEKTLLSFIRAVSHKGLFDTWYMEWTARN